MREKMAPIQEPAYGQWAVKGLRACVDHLASQPGASTGIGVLGFCFGGSYSFAVAAADSRIRAAVPFYGQPPETSETATICCPVLAFYGDQDERLMEGLPAVTSAMAEAGIDFTAQVYPGVGHAFFNDTNPATYDEAAAADAWRRTLSFLELSLRQAGR
jgi:carboxymethylenebutenolidase